MREESLKISMKKDAKWLTSCLNSNSTVEMAAKSLNNSGLRIVLVLDDNSKFIGTITDGDIRRGLLGGLSLASGILPIINRAPVTTTSISSNQEVFNLMKVNKIQQVPILNEKNNVIGLHTWDKLQGLTEHSNVLAIMAGGFGKRLYPETENCPKPMLLVRGKPILEHVINNARKSGFTKIYITTHFMSEKIEEYFGDGSAFDVDIDYIREEFPLGTAGSLSILSELDLGPIVVTNGDVITSIPYHELLTFHLENNANATMAIRSHEWVNPFGVVTLDGNRIVAYQEKPIIESKINAGVYVLNRKSLKLLKPNEYCDMPTLFENVKKEFGEVLAFPIFESWMDVGRPSDLIFANSKESDINYL